MLLSCQLVDVMTSNFRSVLKTAYPGQYCRTSDSISSVKAEYLGQKRFCLSLSPTHTLSLRLIVVYKYYLTPMHKLDRQMNTTDQQTRQTNELHILRLTSSICCKREREGEGEGERERERERGRGRGRERA